MEGHWAQNILLCTLILDLPRMMVVWLINVGNLLVVWGNICEVRYHWAQLQNFQGHEEYARILFRIEFDSKSCERRLNVCKHQWREVFATVIKDLLYNLRTSNWHMASLLSFRRKLGLRMEHSWLGTGSWLLHILFQKHINGSTDRGVSFWSMD